MLLGSPLPRQGTARTDPSRFETWKVNISVNISGSKNASLPILAATLLTREKCVIRRVPDVSDTNYMLQILQNLGAEVERASGTVTVKAEKLNGARGALRSGAQDAGIDLRDGPAAGADKEAIVSLPGGCVIGDRPIDLHLRGLEGLGPSRGSRAAT
jgi:UDP-N-acetylglucosamine 1-carboxyvinyltransferase